jgi:hypothetical protein
LLRPSKTPLGLYMCLFSCTYMQTYQYNCYIWCSLPGPPPPPPMGMGIHELCSPPPLWVGGGG